MKNKEPRNNGGSAFPGREFNELREEIPSEGMTMRQWYKGQVVSVLRAYTADPKTIAKQAGEIADALIEEDGREN